MKPLFAVSRSFGRVQMPILVMRLSSNTEPRGSNAEQVLQVPIPALLFHRPNSDDQLRMSHPSPGSLSYIISATNHAILLSVCLFCHGSSCRLYPLYS